MIPNIAGIYEYEGIANLVFRMDAQVYTVSTRNATGSNFGSWYFRPGIPDTTVCDR